MYQLISGTYSLEGETYLSFGIQCGNIMIEDISMEQAEVEELIALCNQEKLDVLHLPDVVADFLDAPEIFTGLTALSLLPAGRCAV